MKKRSSRLQKGTHVSEDDMAGGSNHHQVKRRRVKKKSFSWLRRRNSGSSKGEMAGGSEHRQVKRKRVEKERASSIYDILGSMKLENAKMALEFYQKSQDAEFEVLEVLDISALRLQHPESESCHLWCHASFIAKQKNADCNVPPKHFFAEFFRDNGSSKFHVTYCSTFEPSDDLRFYHGCMICLPSQRFHPSDGYSVGRPPWYKPRRICGHPPWAPPPPKS